MLLHCSVEVKKGVSIGNHQFTAISSRLVVRSCCVTPGSDFILKAELLTPLEGKLVSIQ